MAAQLGAEVVATVAWMVGWEVVWLWLLGFVDEIFWGSLGCSHFEKTFRYQSVVGKQTCGGFEGVQLLAVPDFEDGDACVMKLLRRNVEENGGA